MVDELIESINVTVQCFMEQGIREMEGKYPRCCLITRLAGCNKIRIKHSDISGIFINGPMFLTLLLLTPCKGWTVLYLWVEEGCDFLKKKIVNEILKSLFFIL